MIIKKSLILILLLCPIWPISSHADGTKVFNSVKDSVVSIVATSDTGISSFGSGVIIKMNEVVTNCHVIEESQNIKVSFSDNSSAIANVKGKVAELDLCILDVPTGKLPVASIRQLSEIDEGETVFAVGNPLKLKTTISNGIVSSIRQTKQGRIIQITNPISKGSSGGGLFDKKGLLLGITTFSFTAGQNLNFAIPAEYIKSLGAFPLQSSEKVSAGKVLTFKGLPMGASVSDFIKEFPQAKCNESIPEGTINCRGNQHMYLGTLAENYFAGFSNDQLDMVIVKFFAHGHDREKLALSLRDKIQSYFGKPNDDNLESIDDESFKSGGSAHWVLPDSYIDLLRCGNIYTLFMCDFDGVELRLRKASKTIKPDF